MNVLETMKSLLRVLGCIPDKLPSSITIWIKQVPIHHIHIILNVILLIHNLISTVWFWQYDTQTQSERLQSSFFVFRSGLCLVLYVQLIRKRQNLADLITLLEEMIEKSRFFISK